MNFKTDEKNNLITMKKPIIIINLIFQGILLIFTSNCSFTKGDFSFGLIGDIPYFEGEADSLKNMINEMNLYPLAFVIHVGDFKKEKEPCTDKLYHSRKKLFEMSRHPLIYTPGDNDWADCQHDSSVSRTRNNPEFYPINRLMLIRSLFFKGNPFHQDQLKISRQSENPAYFDFLENLKWTYNKILFATFNMPGDAKGKHDLTGKYHVKRIKAALQWVDGSFNLAGKLNSPGIVLITHANPWISKKEAHGYLELIRALKKNTIKFDKPVLFIHGDSHKFRVDKPLKIKEGEKPILEKFNRLESFGAPNPYWVKVNVSTDTKDLFSYKPRNSVIGVKNTSYITTMTLTNGILHWISRLLKLWKFVGFAAFAISPFVFFFNKI